MKTNRHILVAAFLFTAAVFVWASFYIPASQFQWTVKIGSGEYGLCHMKSFIMFALGDRYSEAIPSSLAAATVAVALGVPALLLISLVTRLWSRIHRHETRMA
ncbi:MAG: hypothetical protein GX456_11060 [Verrucomicrobia bacterium]|nr:hypothetical protein [Verrucomicrobiota bacterium]